MVQTQTQPKIQFQQAPTTHPQWAYFEGKLVPIGDAKISIMTQVVNYGIGTFGGVRAYWNERENQLYVFRIDDHIRRFLNSGKLFNAQYTFTASEIRNAIIELLRREGYREDAYVRPLIYNATEDITPRMYDVEFRFACFTKPLGNYISLQVRAGTSSWRRVDDNIIPARGKVTGAYVNSALAKSEAHWNGFDEAIVLNQDGHVSEGSAMNLYIVRDGKLITSPVSDNILEGITRKTTLQLAHDLGIETTERSIDRTELYVADEVMFCGTGAQVAGVIEVDHRAIGDGKLGPITRKMQDAYFAVVRGENAKYKNWLTPVYT